MARILRDVTIECSCEVVFGVLRDIDRLPEFSDMTVSVEGGPGRPVEVGDTFDQVVKVAGKELDTQWEVVAVEPPHLLQFSGRSVANGRATLIERFTPADGGCRVEMEVDYDLPLGFLGELLDALVVERRNEKEAETILSNLKALCTGEPR